MSKSLNHGWCIPEGTDTRSTNLSYQITQSPNWNQLKFAQSCHSVQISIANQQQIDHDRLLIASAHTKKSYALHMSQATFFQICFETSDCSAICMRIERAPRVKKQCIMRYIVRLYCMSESLFCAHRVSKTSAHALNPSKLNAKKPKNWSEQDSNLQPRVLSIITTDNILNSCTDHEDQRKYCNIHIGA